VLEVLVALDQPVLMETQPGMDQVEVEVEMAEEMEMEEEVEMESQGLLEV